MEETAECLAFIGIGWMGSGMAINLQKSLATEGRQLLIHNRTRTNEQVEATEKAGAKYVSLEEIASQADIIMTCLANDDAAMSVFNQLQSFLEANGRKGIIFAEMSTLSPKTIEQLSQMVEPTHHFTCCPIFGPPAAAASATLLVLLSGRQDIREKLRSLFVPTIGRAALDLGEDITKASKMKLVGNYFILSLQSIIAEGLTLGEKCGLGEEQVVDYLEAFFPNTVLPVYAKRMNRNEFLVDPSTDKKAPFAVSLARKDAGHIQELGREYNCPLQAVELTDKRLAQVAEEHSDTWDVTSVIVPVREASQLPYERKKQE
ncbi:hypothetical protein PROFUN_00231 [Planoprotostelium fungivorum]|uniref:Uncharacterized protein n=1 Tax=Planoprotostelium fungivorum TaxID=1890364 RepID=A0A2P6NXS4_9EUKA|nr:hypothetical protein PROFUN_00231 [Planoprotostelium fungivorum]